MKNRLGTAGIVLLMILGLRLFGQIEQIMSFPKVGPIIMFCIYLPAVIGVYKRKSWGDILCGIVGIIDVAMTIPFTEGANRIGSLVVDCLMLYFAYEDYKNLALMKKSQVNSAEETTSGNKESG